MSTRICFRCGSLNLSFHPVRRGRAKCLDCGSAVMFYEMKKESETMPRPVKVKYWLICPRCDSIDARVFNADCAFEREMGVCNQCKHEFYTSECKPWLRPNDKGQVRGDDCCNACFTKFCPFHDSASYTRTGHGDWYYKLVKPDPELDVCHRASEDTRKRRPKLKPPRRVTEGVAPLPVQEAEPVPSNEEKPGGVPTERSWSGDKSKEKSSWVKKFLIALIITLLGNALWLGGDWVLHWLGVK